MVRCLWIETSIAAVLKTKLNLSVYTSASPPRTQSAAIVLDTSTRPLMSFNSLCTKRRPFFCGGSASSAIDGYISAFRRA